MKIIANAKEEYQANCANSVVIDSNVLDHPELAVRLVEIVANAKEETIECARDIAINPNVLAHPELVISLVEFAANNELPEEMKAIETLATSPLVLNSNNCISIIERFKNIDYKFLQNALNNIHNLNFFNEEGCIEKFDKYLFGLEASSFDEYFNRYADLQDLIDVLPDTNDEISPTNIAFSLKRKKI